MKNRLRVLIIGLISLALYSCEKNANQIIDTKEFNGPFLRGYNFSPSGPTVNVYVNDIKVTAIGSTNGKEATAGIAAYGVFPTTNSYVNLTSKGNVTVKSVIPSTATTNPGVVTSTINGDLQEGKYYSFFTCGLYNTTDKTTSSVILEDKIPTLDTAAAYLRFVNLVPNAPNGYDLVITNRATSQVINLSPTLAFKAASDFVKVPAGIYDLRASSVGGTVINRTELTISKSYVYSLITRGTAVTASTLAIDMTRNR
ncbi:DUF4397 domain-containing protein [Pedobacter xixiisoli]|uniref:DUF4397 domain-containing protein n=1 Tax=Pedobacter xixiisoli TaxID=1476464 RepID=A0A286ADW4_9SPHI|nr:DUF4397 domain-containing protein [Pedobacter xixiisoli]SOD20089.1 protein of unknown function [Pedobacter xixiisoli]